ncbi:MAG: ASCH domain-containing protein [Oscillospiraceae bacterium]|nr:ASCH domain-containing protein [Oscillospiraceae bacterium]
MVQLYVDLIHKGLRTIDQVPERWREEVRAALEQ